MIKKIFLVLVSVLSSSVVFAEPQPKLDKVKFVKRALKAEKDPNFISTQNIHVLGYTATFRNKKFDQDQLKGIETYALLEPNQESGHLILLETLLDCKNYTEKTNVYFYDTKGNLTETAQEDVNSFKQDSFLFNACQKINKES
jgi:hypothetical protein